MLDNPILLIIALIAVTIGAVLQSLAGVGMALIAAPILVLIEPNFLPAPILALGCFLSLLNTVNYRHKLHLGNTQIALIGRVPGSVLGVYLLTLLPLEFFYLVFSIFVVLSVLLTYRDIRVSPSSCNLFIAGFFSGLMGTTTSVGGPPIALAYQNSSPEKARAELGLFFLVGTIISLTLLWIADNISYHQIQLTLPLLPAILLGFLLSRWLDKHFKPYYFKPLIASLSVILGLVIFIKAMATFNPS